MYKIYVGNILYKISGLSRPHIMSSKYCLVWMNYLFCTTFEWSVNHWMLSLTDRASFSFDIFRISFLSLIISWLMSCMASWFEGISLLSVWSKALFLSITSMIWFLVWFLSTESKAWFLIIVDPGYSVGGYPALRWSEEGGADGLNWPCSTGLLNCIGVWILGSFCPSPCWTVFL